MKRKVLLIVCLFLLALLFVIINNTNCKESNDLKDFTNNTYKNFNGGESAKAFFDEYCEIDNYEKVRFYYSDFGKRISLHKYYTVFDVDVKYSNEMYLAVKESLLRHTEKNDPDYNKLNDYVVSRIINNKEIYRNNTACICYNDEACVIRYLFICKLKSEEDTNIRAIIPWNFGEAWTLDEWAKQ